MKDDGQLHLDQVVPIVEHLIGGGVSGLYVCGSTGEGMSLTGEERQRVTEAFVAACAGRMPVIVQVGHNSLAEAQQLAAHAARAGADIVSATCPSYFKITDVASLVSSMADVAAGAPDLPFYYYHIPTLTGAKIDMVEFLQLAGERIPNLAGLKYTDMALHEFQLCQDVDGGRFDILWGCDEMLLGALATGAHGAIGSTYNIAAPLYRRIIGSYEQGDMRAARTMQLMAARMIRTIAAYPFHPAMKEVLKMLGIDLGGCRAPQRNLAANEIAALRAQLEAIGFFDWASSLPSETSDTDN
jgi:N-acetylneuraminate lyase